MAIKKKIDNLTSNIFLSISRISIVRTISNTLSSVLCGTVGFVFITRATKQVAKGRTTAAFIISGLGLAFIGLIIGFFLVALKGG